MSMQAPRGEKTTMLLACETGDYNATLIRTVNGKVST